MEDGKFVAEQINSVIGKKFPKTIIVEKSKVEFVDGADEVAFIQVFAGEKILSKEDVTALGEKIVSGKRSILIHFLPQHRYFLKGVGEL